METKPCCAEGETRFIGNHDIAVYAEHSLSKKAIQPGWNRRMFNKTEVQGGTMITLDKQNGIISLKEGIYHITGCSSVTYTYPDPDPEAETAEEEGGAGWPTKEYPNGGYCRLVRYCDKDPKNENALVVGTISNANMLPSFFDTYVKVEERLDLILEHQAGFDNHDGMEIEEKEAPNDGTSIVDNVVMQEDAIGSPWHIFARISIRRV